MATDEAPRSPLVKRAMTALDNTHKAAVAYERDDLAKRLERTEEKLADPSFNVLVVGEFKQGKSSLVNALLDTDVCPVDDDIATAVPTAIRYAPDAHAAVLFKAPENPDDEYPPDPIREQIPVAEAGRFVTENADGDGRTVQAVEIGLPSQRLQGGLVIVDTPGVGGLGSRHSTITMGALPMAEAVLFVTDAGQEFTAPEIEFMESARKLCPNMVVLLTKIDFYPAWRKIRDINAGHLERLGITADIVPVSSTLHAHAKAAGDDALDQESGFPDLLAYLDKEIIDKAEELTVVSAVGDLHSVVDQLADFFRSKRASLNDPEGAKANLAQLEEARAAADELKSRAARWQQTLNDGVQDLTTEVDHDLRARFRKITQAGDDALENIDPADAWDEFEPWLYRRVAEDVVNNYRFLQQMTGELAVQVAEHFALENQQLAIDLEISDPTAALGRIEVEANIEVETTGMAATAFTAVRGGYIGPLMLTGLGGIVGVSIFPPVGIAVGLAMGRKAIKDEKERAVAQRQAQARNALRKYIDEATFMANKDSRDGLRRSHRRLRDFFTERAEEQSRSMGEKVSAAQSAARADQEERKKGLADCNAELKRLTELRKRIEMITPAASRPKPDAQ